MADRRIGVDALGEARAQRRKQQLRWRCVKLHPIKSQLSFDLHIRKRPNFGRDASGVGRDHPAPKVTISRHMGPHLTREAIEETFGHRGRHHAGFEGEWS